MSVTLDVLLERALGALAAEDRWLGRLAGLDPDPPRAVDPAPLLSALPKAEGPARTLLAEGALLAGTARTRRLDREARAARDDRLGVRRDGRMRALRLEGDAARRSAILAAVLRAEEDGRAASIAVVESIRAGLEAVAAALPGSPARAGALATLGWSTLPVRASAEAVLSATDDPFRELSRHRARAVLGHAPASLADVAAMSRAAFVDRVMPLPDRAGIASRWVARVGLGLPSVAALPGASEEGPAPRVLSASASERPKVAFAPAPDAHGVLELASLVGELVALPAPTPDAALAAHRRGATRIAAPLSATLARRLLLSPGFLVREAGLDRSAVEAALRELVFVELLRLRTLALEALALVLALEREGGLGERIAELHARALGVPLAPTLAPARVVEAFEDAAPAALEAALAECALEARLVAEHDEDFFRNPRAGAAIERGLVLAGALGAAEGASEPSEALAAHGRALEQRLARWWRDADA